jgi:hypothetical protein
VSPNELLLVCAVSPPLLDAITPLYLAAILERYAQMDRLAPQAPKNGPDQS